MLHRETGGHSRPDRLFRTALFLTTALRLIYASVIPLTGDEAYFWEWARHPALSYYDHPPFAGWLLWLLTGLFGDSVVVVRSTAVVSGTLIVLVIHRLTEEITGSSSAAAFAGILAMGVPVLAVLGVLYSTDTPLLLACTLGGYLFYRATESGDARAWWGVGLCFACALMSKFLAVPIIAACFGYLILSAGHRRHLSTAGPYIAFGLSAAGLIPILWWNSRNDWATFVFNFSSRHSELSLGLVHPSDYIIGQALALSPLVLVFALPALRPCLVPGRSTVAWGLPGFLAIVPLGGFLVLSLANKIGLHWPAVSVPFLIVSTASFLMRGEKHGWHLFGTIASAWTLTLLIFLLPFAAGIIPENWEYPLRPEKINAAQLKKMTAATSETGHDVARVMEELAAVGPSFAFTRSYALSSLIAYYTPGHPDVTVLGEGSAHGRSHLLWFEPAEHEGENAVFVSYRDLEKEREFLMERFERVEPVGVSSPAHGAPPVTIARCYGFKGRR